jgi:nucleotide-binding universal stress UspA family protein
VLVSEPSSPDAITGQLNYSLIGDSYTMEVDRVLREKGQQSLEEQRDRLLTWLDNDLVIECVLDNAALSDGIDDVVGTYQAGLVVVGVSEDGHADLLLGNNLLEVADHSACPVLIVPQQAPMEPISRVVFAYDLAKMTDTFPIQSIKQFLSVFNAVLMVVHIDKDHAAWSEETQGPGGFPDLKSLLLPYAPTYDFIENEDIVAGITEYSEEHRADLILTIGRQHGFFRNLFHRSVNHKLAFHSPIPLLVLGENK